MEYKNLPPELKCQIYSNITNLPDIRALLTTYRHDEEQLALIYDCITTIENNDPLQPDDNGIEMEDIEKFRNLQNLKAPVNIYEFRDIIQLQNLRYLRKLTMIINMLGLDFEAVVYHMLYIIPDNIDRMYFTDPDRLILYHYDKVNKFFAIAIYSFDALDFSISVRNNIRNIISAVGQINEFYIQLPENFENNAQHRQNAIRYINYIVPEVLRRNQLAILLGDAFTIFNSIPLNMANRFIILYNPITDHMPLVYLEDWFEDGEVFVNVKELHGLFTINFFLNVADSFPNLHTLGFYIVNPTGATYYHEIVNEINLLNPKIQYLTLYAHPSRIDGVRQYFSQQLARSRFELQFLPITYLQSYDEDLLFDSNLLN